jgi:subfamily B ATP-binding cassette protein HlyB/CyaB
VFLAVMFFLLAAADAGSCSARSRLLSRSRRRDAAVPPAADEKFRRGAENQAFLVESVTGIETLKAHGGRAADAAPLGRAARRLRGASFRVLKPRQYCEPGVQLVSKIVTAGILYFGAELVIDGSLSVGELVAFNILAGRVARRCCGFAQIWQDFHQRRCRRALG